MFYISNRKGDLDESKLAVINGYIEYLYNLNTGFDVIYDNAIMIANQLRTMTVEEHDKMIVETGRTGNYSRIKHYYEYRYPAERAWLHPFGEYVYNTRKNDGTKSSRDEARRIAHSASYMSMKYGGLVGIINAVKQSTLPKTVYDKKTINQIITFFQTKEGKEVLSSYESAGMIDIPALDIIL